jgi:hypothetical protein
VRWSAMRLIEQALPNRSELPWVRETLEPSGLVEALSQEGIAPALIILGDYISLDGATIGALKQYVAQGGSLLLCASDKGGYSGVKFADLGVTGIEGGEPKFSSPRSSRYSMLSWVDLEHPVFTPFQGRMFNDFSSLRYFNYVPLDVDENADGVTVLARFDDEQPAMVEAIAGKGRVLLWPYSLQLKWTNMPKTTRFVPLLHETVMYLTDAGNEQTALSVGESINDAQIAWSTGDTSLIQEPGVDAEHEVARADFATDIALDTPGFLKSRALSESEWEVVKAVNVDGFEGDDTPISEAEFLLKLATAPMVSQEMDAGGLVGSEVDDDGFVIEHEYGRGLLAALFVLILAELFYMSVLSSRGTTSKPANPA